jgi:hypothetical protein
MDERFACRATAALLRSGSSIALAGHVAALLAILMKPEIWWPLPAWCALVYFVVRVELDARLFELLAESSHAEALDHDANALDEWMASAGLRKASGSRTIADRRRGAIHLWRALLAALIVELILAAGALVWLPR